MKVTITSRNFNASEHLKDTIEKKIQKQSLTDEIGNIIRQEAEKEYYVVKTLESIVGQYDKKLSIEGVSEELGVSASYLSRRFKKVTGSTFLEILNEYRVIQSVKLLASGQYRVGEIAEKTGFSDEDAENIKESLRTLFVNDTSSARPDGSIEVRKLYWWKHNCSIGQYSSAQVHRALKIEIKEGVDVPKCFEDYIITVEPLKGLEVEIIDGI